MSDPIQIEAFPPTDRRTASFTAVHTRIGYPLEDDPVGDDSGCLLARRGDQPVARLSMCIRDDLVGAPGRSGLLGHYEAVEPEAAVSLLRRAVGRLRDLGVDRVLGPMNGSTWTRYRIALPRPATRSPNEPEWFLGEPMNPPTYAQHFVDAGFEVAANYESRVEVEPAPQPGRAAARRQRFEEHRLTLRALDPDRFDEELRTIYELSLSAFARNPYYSPIDWPRFHAMYAGMRKTLDPALVRLLHDADGRLVGFAFAFRDPFDRRGRVVLKTLAVAPEMRGLGLGGDLMADVSRVAHEIGAPAVIHALMHVANASTGLSAHHATRPFRRYALYRA